MKNVWKKDTAKTVDSGLNLVKHAMQRMRYFLRDRWRQNVGGEEDSWLLVKSHSTESLRIDIQLPLDFIENNDTAKAITCVVGPNQHREAETVLSQSDRFNLAGIHDTGLKIHEVTASGDVVLTGRHFRIGKTRQERAGEQEMLRLFMNECEELAKDKEEIAVERDKYREKYERLVSELAIRDAAKPKSHFTGNRQVEQAIESLNLIPISLSKVLVVVGKLFPSQLAIAESALKSANKLSKTDGFWSKLVGLNTAWGMLYDLATTGHGLFFPSKSHELERIFNSQSRFRLAMTERRATKRNSKFMKERRFVHDGTSHDMTPHLKFGKQPPRLIRLHFAIDRENTRLIVGHFGCHLTNASTRRQ